MPNTEQISARLFKKDLSTGDTSTARQFFEEPFSSGALVKPSQILSQFNEVPGTAPIGMVHDEIIGVVQRKIDVVLGQVPGTTNSFQNDALKDAIPFNHSDGSYNYEIKDNLDNPLFFGQGDWVVDTVAGILIFYGSVPPNMPPKISFYKYVGDKGTGSQTYYIVPDFVTRDAIPPVDRREGTMCYVQFAGDTFQLQGGIDNADWVNITKLIGLPEVETLANNSSDSIILVEWASKENFIIYYRAERGAATPESGQIRVDYFNGQVYYSETGGRLANLGLTIDFNINGANIEFDWITTDNVDDVELIYTIGAVAYSDVGGGGGGGDMFIAVYDPTAVNGDAFDMDNMVDGSTNRLYDSTEKSKLLGIEAGAQVNPSAATIKTQYESNANTNAYTDADVSKLLGIEAGAQVNPDAAAVKTLYESNANTNPYTDAEAAKLAGLESSKFLGQYTTLLALQTAHPDPGGGGFYGDVNPGIGQNVQRYIWDVDDAEYIIGGFGGMTSAEIKVSYESNANTNAYTDADVSKLLGIEAGAEVNPTAATIKTQYESNANTNAYTDADVSKLLGIEAGAQVNVGEEYTTAEQTKLLGIEAGAQVNVGEEYTTAEQTKLANEPDGEWLHNIAESGRLWGGLITSNGDGTIAISAGAGIVKADDVGAETVPTSINQGQGSKISLVSWDAVASLTLTDNAYNYIYYNESTNTLLSTTDFYAISFTKAFTLGRGYRTGNTVIIRLCGTNVWNFNRRVQLFGEEVFPVKRAKGMIISAVGNRNIAITSGVLWAELVNRFSVSAFNSSTGGTFVVWYNNGTWQQVAAQTQINNTQYNNYGVGLVNLNNNQYGVHWVYEVHNSSIHVVYGIASYTLANAQLAQPPSELPGLVGAYATLVGKIIIERNATTIYSAQSAFETTFSSSEAPIHNDLGGLNDGDYQHLSSVQIVDLTTGINADAQHVHGTEAVDYSALHPHINTLQDVINHIWSIGTCGDGLDITNNGDGTVNVSAGGAVLRTTNSGDGELFGYALSAVTNLALTDNATNYIMADYNGGAPQIIASISLVDVLADNTKALIWAVNRLGNTLYMVDLRMLNVDYMTKSHTRRYKTQGGVQHAGGAMIADLTNMAFSVTAGDFYVMNKNITFAAFTSNVGLFEYVYRNGSGGFTRVAGQSVIDYLHYDDGTGTLALTTNHYYGCHYVYAVINQPTVFKVMYGVSDYTTLADAQNASAPAILPSDLNTLLTAILIGKIIVGEDYPAAFQDIQSPFTKVLTSAIVNNHNNLAGLQGGTLFEYYHLTATQLADLLKERIFGASVLDIPLSASWPVNEIPLLDVDSIQGSTVCRQFDDTTSQGVDFTKDGISIPLTANTMRITLEWRAQTAPGAVSTVGLGLYNKNLTTAAAWSAVSTLADISVPTNTNRQTTIYNISLAAYIKGDNYKFELVRKAPTAGTNLPGFWNLFMVEIKFFV